MKLAAICVVLPVLCLAAVLFSGEASATDRSDTDCQWAIEYSGDVDVQAVGTFEGSACFIAGGYTGQPGFGCGSAIDEANGTDVFVVSYDAEGECQWAHGFGEGTNFQAAQVAMDLAVDPEGGVVIVGNFGGFLGFAAGRDTLVSTGTTSDMFVAKLSSIGDPIWWVSFGNQYETTARSTAVDADGNVYLYGSMEGDVDFGGGTLEADPLAADLFVAVFDGLDGSHLWSMCYPGSNAEAATSLATLPGGGFAITGSILGDLDLGQDVISADGGSRDIFVAHFTGDASNGFLEDWAYSYGGSQPDDAWDLCAGPDGSVYGLAKFNGTIDVYDSVSFTSTGGPDVLLTKVDGDGTWDWAQRVGGPYMAEGWELSVEAGGDVILTGQFETYMGIAEGDTIGSNLASDRNMFLLKRDGDTGASVWGEWFTSTDLGGDSGLALALDRWDYLYLVGRKASGEGMSFGGTCAAGSQTREFLVKFGGVVTASDSGVLGAGEGYVSNAIAFPNPAFGPTSFRFDLSAPRAVEVHVLDVQGRKVRSLFSGRMLDGSQTVVWDGCAQDGRKVARGAYFMAVEDGTSTTSAAVVLLH